MFKKYLSVLAVLLVLILGSSSTVLAQKAQTIISPSKTSRIPEISKLKKSVATAETDKQANLGDLFYKGLGFQAGAFACLLSDMEETCPRQVNSSGVTSGGAYESLVGFIGTMYEHPPASTQAYVASVMQDLNIGAQPAYAQGIGFAALNPILSVWRTMRNLAYFFFVVLIVVIGFMIMFRQKIGSQAVVTAQQAIPNVIVALLAVTFSYAIAGLLIDFMYLSMFLIAGLFGKVDLIDGNVFQIAGRLINSNVAGEGASAIGEFVGAALGGGVVGALANVFTNITAAIVILLVIVFNTFKLFFALLKTYIELILAIAFAPIVLMMGAIPGQNPFVPWIKTIIANLAVFPMILVLLIVFDVLKEATTNTTGGFLPPYLAGFSDPSVLPFLAGLAMILALPQAVDEIKKALGGTQGGLFFNLVQAGIKNANQYRGVATGLVAGGTLGTIGGAVVGGTLAAKGKIPGVRPGVRGTTMGALGGAVIGGIGAPVALGLANPVARAAGKIAQYGSYIPGFAAGAAAFGPQVRNVFSRGRGSGGSNAVAQSSARTPGFGGIPIPFDDPSANTPTSVYNQTTPYNPSQGGQGPQQATNNPPQPGTFNPIP